MEPAATERRRADSPTVAGNQLLLYRAGGEIARIAVVVDQLDDLGLRTPLVEDVLSAFPHGELHVTVDRRARSQTPVAGRVPVVWDRAAPRKRSFFGRRLPSAPAPTLGAYDVMLRIGDRRSRGFQARTEALDLTYILALENGGNDETGAAQRFGPSLQERSALQSADVVWCSSRRLMATLRRRWHVDANLLYPPAELHGAEALPYGRQRLVAVADGISPAWQARLGALARYRPDLDIILHGTPDARGRDRRWTVVPPSPEDFRALLPEARAVIMPPSDLFDPRVIWAQEAGVPVIAPTRSAAAETIDGLERRDPTGLLLEDLTDEALLDAVSFIEHHDELFRPERLQENAARWSRQRFRGTLKSLVFDAWCKHLGLLERAAEDGDALQRQRSGAIA